MLICNLMKLKPTKRLVDRAHTWAVFNNSAGVIFESTMLEATPGQVLIICTFFFWMYLTLSINTIRQYTTHLTKHATRSIEEIVPPPLNDVFQYPSRMVVFESLQDTTKFMKTKYTKDSNKTFSLLTYNNLIYVNPSLPPPQLLSQPVMHKNLFFNCFRRPLAFTNTFKDRGSPTGKTEVALEVAAEAAVPAST